MLLSIGIFLVGLLLSKGKIFNCNEIVKMHFCCFKKRTTQKYSVFTIFMAFGVPALLTLALIQIRTVENDVLDIITVIISILTAMLFTMLTMILDMKTKIDSDTSLPSRDAMLSAKLLKEVYYSIMFEIFISILVLIACFIELFSKKYSIISSVFIYYMSLVFLFNLIIVLNRVFEVIKNNLS